MGRPSPTENGCHGNEQVRTKSCRDVRYWEATIVCCARARTRAAGAITIALDDVKVDVMRSKVEWLRLKATMRARGSSNADRGTKQTPGKTPSISTAKTEDLDESFREETHAKNAKTC